MTTVPSKQRPVYGRAGKYGQGLSKRAVTAVVLTLWVLAMFVQAALDPSRPYFNPMLRKGAESNFIKSLKNNMFGASFLGLREVVAGMLWVKADELFHEGRYQELVPYFSLVTFMDPHQVDVYSTGAWHLMYNFGDPRMVPQGLAFLKEGIENNPNVWDLYFQYGWVNFDWPIEDYTAALPYLREAAKHPGVNGTDTPPFVRHMIAHDLLRMGKIDAAKTQWRANIAFAEAQIAKAKKDKNASDLEFWQQERDVSRNNLDRVIVDQIDRKNLANKQIPLQIQASFHRVRPRVLEVEAKILNMPVMHADDGSISNARMEIVLQDKDYDKLLAQHKTDFAWIGKHLTRYRSIYNIVEANGTVTDKGKPTIFIELDKDPMLEPPRNPTDLYPLQSQQYDLILRLDPAVRRQPDEVRDHLGWIGEAIKKSPQVVIGSNGKRVLEYHITVNRDQIV